MDRLEYLTLPDYGLSNKDVKYFHIDSVVTGRGPDRLRYLDIEGTLNLMSFCLITFVAKNQCLGRWVLNGRSIPYISAAFNHWENTNLAREAFRVSASTCVHFGGV